MFRGFVISLIVLGTSACATNQADAPAVNELSSTSADYGECYCSARKRQQVKARLDKKKQTQ